MYISGSLGTLQGLHELPAFDLVLETTYDKLESGFPDLELNCKLLRDGIDGTSADLISTDRICGTSGAISLLFGMDIVG
jgi:hypothetical protein